MKLHRFDDANQFYTRVKDYLLNHEVHHCLLLGIIDTLIHYPERYNCQPYLAAVEVEDNVVAVAIKTAPYKLVLSKIKDFGAVEAIARDLQSNQEPLPGVSGLTAEAKAFAEAWQTLTDQSYQPGLQMRIHQLHAVQSVPRSSGYLRQGNESDRALLLQWYEAFELEVFGTKQGNAERIIDHQLKQNTVYLWQDPIPVSMVGCARSTPNSKCIGPVYTPPEYRKKGYATSCVADLSQMLLDRGSQFCCLFTDLANPTSNHIYQTIGYQPIDDWNEYIFGGKSQ